ncbi:MAG: hypothetical protein ACYSTS_02700 [Planctomycetota bacterium]
MLNRIVKLFFLYVVIFIVLIVMFEGLCSLIIFSYNLINLNRGPRFKIHVRHDEQLGWINLPNAYIEDAYGPGKEIKINSQSFRCNDDFLVTVPDGKLRVMCSGDSYTFGVGVGNNQTWCDLLSSLQPRFETVNLGESGYGIGQALLKYKRCGSQLNHDIHVFAFIYHDFLRTTMKSFLSYDKPEFILKNNEIIVNNVPVPLPNSFIKWLKRKKQIVRELKSVQLGSGRFRKVKTATPYKENIKDTDQRKKVVIKIFEEINKLNSEKGSTAVFVYLPIGINKSQNTAMQEEEWRKFLLKELEKRKILFIDLVSEFEKLPYGERNMMIDPEWLHFSEKGNEYIARLLYKKLISFPEISKKIEEKR